MDDIVERLRWRIHTSEDETALTNEASDEIERLREALRLTNRIIMNFSEKSVQIHNDLLTTIPKIEAALKESE